jgi:hypothetical protein
MSAFQYFIDLDGSAPDCEAANAEFGQHMSYPPGVSRRR